MSYDHQEIGDFANERDAQDWAERNNLDVRDLHYRNRGSRGVTLSVRRSALWTLQPATSHMAAGPAFSETRRPPMKLKYLLFALLAAGAQPSLAAEPASGLGETAIEPAAAVSAVRRQELQRVADALNAEASAKAAVNTRDAAPAIKTRFKAMKRPSPTAEQPDCDDCPDKVVAPQAHSASQTHKSDCIQCIDKAVLA